MIITSMPADRLNEVRRLMELGEPYISARTLSDYWLYATLFSSTCPVALAADGRLAGAVVAFRSQVDPADVYIQDVMTDPAHRRQGIARALLNHVRSQAEHWGCARLYLTSEPDNQHAHLTWTAFGFRNIAGSYSHQGISITSDFKGPGRDRAVYELRLE